MDDLQNWKEMMKFFNEALEVVWTLKSGDFLKWVVCTFYLFWDLTI